MSKEIVVAALKEGLAAADINVSTAIYDDVAESLIAKLFNSADKRTALVEYGKEVEEADKKARATAKKEKEPSTKDK
jgi:hypothetical protein